MDLPVIDQREISSSVRYSYCASSGVTRKEFVVAEFTRSSSLTELPKTVWATTKQHQQRCEQFLSTLDGVEGTRFATETLFSQAQKKIFTLKPIKKTTQRNFKFM